MFQSIYLVQIEECNYILLMITVVIGKTLKIVLVRLSPVAVYPGQIDFPNVLATNRKPDEKNLPYSFL